MMRMRQTVSGRPVMSEQLKRKDYEIATLKQELCEQRRELNELRQQMRRKHDEPTTVYVMDRELHYRPIGVEP